MGKKAKKKSNNRMPASSTRGSVPNPSSSPEDSTTNLGASSGNPESIVDVDKNDKQTPGELNDNMSSALSQVEGGALNHCAKIIKSSTYTDSCWCVANPEDANSVTAGEGTKEDEDKVEESPAPKDANTENPANEVATTTTVGVGNTEGEETVDDVVTKDTADTKFVPIEENSGSQEVGEALSDGVATGNHSEDEGAGTIENAISTEVNAIDEGDTGEADAEAEDTAVGAEAETNSIKDTFSTDDPPASNEAATSNSLPNPEEVSASGGATTSNTEEIATKDHQEATAEEDTICTEGATPSEGATSTDSSGSGEQLTATGETAHGSQSSVFNNVTLLEDGSTTEFTTNEGNGAPGGDDIAAEETVPRDGSAPRDAAGDPIAEDGNVENAGAPEGETTTTTEDSGSVPEKPHVATYAEVEVKLEAVEPLLRDSAEETHIQEHIELIPDLGEVEPEIPQTEGPLILGTVVEATLDEVTPDPNAENEDNDPANTEQTGGEVESTDDTESGEEEATPSEITAPTTEGGSVCGDSTASEVTAATEDTTTDDASTDKAVASGEVTTTAKEGASIEQIIDEAPVVEETPVAERSPASEEGHNIGDGPLEPTDESQVGNPCSTREPATTEGTPAGFPIIENLPVASEALTEETPPEPATSTVEPDATSRTEASSTETETPSSVDPEPAAEAEVPALKEAPATELETTTTGAGDPPTEIEAAPAKTEAPPAGPETLPAETDAPPAGPEALPVETVAPPVEPEALPAETPAESKTLPEEAEAPPTEPGTLPFETGAPPTEPEAPPIGAKVSPAEPPVVESEVLPSEQETPSAGPPVFEQETSHTAGPPAVEPEVPLIEQGTPVAETPTEPEAPPVAPAEAPVPPPTKPDAIPVEATLHTEREVPWEKTPTAKPEESLIEIAMPPEGDATVEGGPSGEQSGGAAPGDPPASPTSKRRKLHWSPENGDETLLGQIIRPHRARRESDASVFTIKAGKNIPDTIKHHHRRRESGASGHSRGDRESLKKKARTPEEEEERKKRKEAKEAMSPEEREERRKRKDVRKAAKEPDQFVIGAHSGDKGSPDKPRHRHERRESGSPSKPLNRPKLLSVFSAESDFKSPIFWINAGTTEIEGMRHPSQPPSPKSPRPPKSRRHSHQNAEEKEAHRLKREERRREKEGQDAQERELKEEKPSSHVSQEANASPPDSSHRKHRTREHRREHHRSSKHGKERATDGDSPMTVFRRVVTRGLKDFFLQ
ncbi:MAG: hypothetical protein M1840_004372 [Geoglossum simile]|nr:MAG: hypothetical protein M1840_004372 [Geoglossum simile]